MPGDRRRRSVRRRRDEVKCEAIGIFGSCGERKPQLQQRIEQPMLGELDPAPMQQVLGLREVGDGAVVAAGRTKCFGVIAGDEPVADVVLRIGAEPIERRNAVTSSRSGRYPSRSPQLSHDVFSK